MENSTFAPLANIPTPPVSPDLFHRVMDAILLARLRQLRRRLIIVASGFTTVLAYTILNGASVLEEIQTSSFFELLRLAITDPDVIFRHLQSLFLGLLETFPFQSALLIITIAFLLLGAIALGTSWQHERHALKFTHA